MQREFVARVPQICHINMSKHKVEKKREDTLDMLKAQLKSEGVKTGFQKDSKQLSVTTYIHPVVE